MSLPKDLANCSTFIFSFHVYWNGFKVFQGKAKDKGHVIKIRIWLKLFDYLIQPERVISHVVTDKDALQAVVNFADHMRYIERLIDRWIYRQTDGYIDRQMDILID